MAAYCRVRYGTKLDFSTAKKVLRRFPLAANELAKVDLTDWDGKRPLAHNFQDVRIDSGRLSCGDLKNSNCVGYPSVSVLIGSIDRKELLFKWQERQIAELGVEGFRKSNRERMSKSVRLHSFISNYLNEFSRTGTSSLAEHTDIAIKNCKVDEGALESLTPLLELLTSQMDENGRMQIISEKRVYNHSLTYSGKFDAILPIEGIPTMIDWKMVNAGSFLSKDSQAGDDAIPFPSYIMQLVAYIAAFNSDPNANFKTFPVINKCAIVKIYESGKNAELVMMNQDQIHENFELFKGWVNAFWYKLANGEPVVADPVDGDMIDFCYYPPVNSNKRTKQMEG